MVFGLKEAVAAAAAAFSTIGFFQKLLLYIARSKNVFKIFSKEDFGAFV